MKYKDQGILRSKCLMYLCGLYIVALIVTAATFHRLISFGGVIEPGGLFVFPLMYFFGDIIAEVYGYPIAKKMIFVAFACDAFFSLSTYFIASMPTPASFHEGTAYAVVFKPLPQLFLISSISMSISEFINIRLISKWRELVNGRFFFIRSVGSSAVGEGVLSLISIPLIFYGQMTWQTTLKIVFSIYLFKMVYTLLIGLLGPILVKILKKVEGEATSFTEGNPLLSR